MCSRERERKRERERPVADSMTRPRALYSTTAFRPILWHSPAFPSLYRDFLAFWISPCLPSARVESSIVDGARFPRWLEWIERVSTSSRWVVIVWLNEEVSSFREEEVFFFWGREGKKNDSSLELVLILVKSCWTWIRRRFEHTYNRVYVQIVRFYDFDWSFFLSLDRYTRSDFLFCKIARPRECI